MVNSFMWDILHLRLYSVLGIHLILIIVLFKNMFISFHLKQHNYKAVHILQITHFQHQWLTLYNNMYIKEMYHTNQVVLATHTSILNLYVVGTSSP